MERADAVEALEMELSRVSSFAVEMSGILLKVSESLVESNSLLKYLKEKKDE